MISIIIASYKEEKSIGGAIESVLQSLNEASIDDFEIIQTTPDNETLVAGADAAKKFGINKKFHQVVDPRKGKAYALNMALKKASGEIIMMTDGDVRIDKKAIRYILQPLKKDRFTATTGQPTPTNNKGAFMGYLAHLLTAAADHKRRSVFSEKREDYYKKEGGYFPMSGYLLAFKNNGFKYNSKYIDDTYLTLLIVSEGHELAYSPKARVYVKFPTNLKDYLKQRRRNILGTRKIHKNEMFKKIEDERSFKKEIDYLFFPINYASNLKEFAFSLCLYPLRIITWIYASFPEKKKETAAWAEIESTKER